LFSDRVNYTEEAADFQGTSGSAETIMQCFLVTSARPQAFLLLAVVVFGTTGCSNQESSCVPSASRAVAAPTPSDLLDLDGQPVDLHQISKGSVRVVVFVRSDCPISNRMAPEVRELCSTYQPKGVDFYLIYVDPHEKPEAIRAHLQEYQYLCPALRDPKHTLVAATKATVTPEAVVYDGDWQIAYRGRINDQFEDFGKSRDQATKHDLRAATDDVLAGRPVAEPVTKAVGCYIDDLK
jgi:cytochrome oxidase Cu insertion factor (SCO1/SenC/PrrC family)